MRDRDLRRAFETLAVPGEEVAERRSWEVVRRALAEREPAAAPRPRPRPWLLGGVAAAAALAAAAFSPPGAAVLDSIRERIGTDRAAPALFSLPAPGRLLVQSERGPWIVAQDGSRRLLGRYREASWSPFGRFAVATRSNELLALDPKGEVRWSLPRPRARLARWGGTRTDTRIAYISGPSLRVVAGDGSGDRELDSRPQNVAPAWRPRAPHQLAYAEASGRVLLADADTRETLWRSRPFGTLRALVWSDDGARLLALGTSSVWLLDGRGRVVTRETPSEQSVAVGVAFVPATHEVVEIRAHGSQSSVFSWRDGRTIFNVAGQLRDLAWSPDGRWLLVTWASADQWVFVRSAGVRRIVAVSDVVRQFGGGRFPRVSGWCCAR